MSRTVVALTRAAIALAAIAASPALAYPNDSGLVPPDIAKATVPAEVEPEATRTASVDARVVKGKTGVWPPRTPTITITARDTAPTHCLPDPLMRVLTEVAERFGEVSVQSTHRSQGRNARAGGARRSLHLDCRAADFRVAGDGRAVLAFLREHPDVGGFKRYRNGLIHIDDGEPRSW